MTEKMERVLKAASAAAYAAGCGVAWADNDGGGWWLEGGTGSPMTRWAHILTEDGLGFQGNACGLPDGPDGMVEFSAVSEALSVALVAS